MLNQMLAPAAKKTDSEISGKQALPVDCFFIYCSANSNHDELVKSPFCSLPDHFWAGSKTLAKFLELVRRGELRQREIYNARAFDPFFPKMIEGRSQKAFYENVHFNNA